MLILVIVPCFTASWFMTPHFCSSEPYRTLHELLSSRLALWLLSNQDCYVKGNGTALSHTCWTLNSTPRWRCQASAAEESRDEKLVFATLPHPAKCLTWYQLRPLSLCCWKACKLAKPSDTGHLKWQGHSTTGTNNMHSWESRLKGQDPSIRVARFKTGVHKVYQ